MKRRIIPTLAVLAAITLTCSFAAYAQRSKTRPKPIRTVVTVTPETAAKYVPIAPEQRRRQEAFLKAWSTLNENYFDKTFGGLDWNKVRREFMPSVNSAKSDADVHRLIEEMVRRLDKSHFALIPPEYFADLRAAQEKAKTREKLAAAAPVGGLASEDDDEDDDALDLNARYGIGVELRYLGGRFVISSVEKRSGATLAGLKPGYVLDKINGVALSELTARLLAAYPNVRHLQRYLPIQIAAWFLNGERDSFVFLHCLDENDQIREYKVPRLTLGGEVLSIGQRFPTQFLQFRTESLNDDVGYVKFNVFGLPVIPKFCDALTEFSAKKAIVVDLRGNLGGLLGTLIGLTGMLSDRPVTIGTSFYRRRSEVIAAKPKAKNFKGKLVFLVDGQTMSAGELFTAALRENNRVLVVGERTAGEALPAGSVELPTGAVLVYPMANFSTPKGKYIEGSGVEPDFPVALDRQSLLNGRDVQLDNALALITDGSAFNKLSGPPQAISGSGDAPPPPKKATPTLLMNIGKGSGISSAPPPAKPEAKDAKALQVLADFTAAVGGPNAIKSLGAYEAVGSARIGEHGADTAVTYHAYREAPDKYSILMASPVLGEIREIHNGKDSFVQSDYGIDADTLGFDSDRTHLFSPLTNLADPALFQSLEYVGEFDDNGQKLKLVQGTVAGVGVAMAFDSRTKLLVRCSVAALSYTLGDYRKVGAVTLPFAIGIERMMTISLEVVKLDAKIDPANFQKKQKCFDKPL